MHFISRRDYLAHSSGDGLLAGRVPRRHKQSHREARGLDVCVLCSLYLSLFNHEASSQ